MPEDTRRAPLSSWDRAVVVAVGVAYRKALGETGGAMPAYRAARDAFLAAGGDPARAGADVPAIVAALARDHPDWLYAPSRSRIAREEAHWKDRGIWPPPKNRRPSPSAGQVR